MKHLTCTNCSADVRPLFFLPITHSFICKNCRQIYTADGTSRLNFTNKKGVLLFFAISIVISKIGSTFIHKHPDHSTLIDIICIIIIATLFYLLHMRRNITGLIKVDTSQNAAFIHNVKIVLPILVITGILLFLLLQI